MRRLPSLGLDRFTGLYLWALFIVVFGIWKPDQFLTMDTLHSVASEQAITGMLAIAVVIPLAAGAYDLSVGATINFATIFVVWLQSTKHLGMWPAIGLAIAAAVAIGVVNGFVVVRLRVNSFIATLGMATIVTAVQSIVVGPEQPIPPISPAWSQLTTTTVFGFQIVVLYLIAIAFLCWWLLAHTPAGRFLYAIGGNEEAARLAGVAVDRWRFLSLVLSGGLAGVAGVLYGSLYGPSLTYGQSLLLPAFAAAFLGATLLMRGRFNVWGTLLAIYVLATGVKGLQLVTGAQWLADMFNGVALITAVAFATWRQGAAQRVRESRSHTAADAPEDGGASSGGSDQATAESYA